jgi:outer membrane receptor protein involved in Fe transport
MRSPIAVAVFLGAACSCLVGTAQAQIDEIIVTTRKTEESLQSVPVAVTALTRDFIEKQGVTTTADVVKMVPGVQFDQAFSAADTRISIRGINSERGRASVAVLVDGIDVSGENITSGGGSSLLNTRLLDLERVEVLKGPHSALYGRNAFAGAINYITRKPSMDEFEINTYGDVADFGTYDIRGSISGPLIEERLAVSLNGGTYSTDGFWSNNNPLQPTANVNLGGGESNGLRLGVLWTPTDRLSFLATVSYSEVKTEPRPVVKVGNANTCYLNEQQLPPGTPPDFTGNGTVSYCQWLGTVSSVDPADIGLSLSLRNNEPFRGSQDNTLLSYLKVDLDTDALTFKSLTSYLSNDAFLHEDVDFQVGYGTPVTRNGIDTFYTVENDYLDETETEYFSQEFTVESADWARGRWLLGVSGFWEETENADSSIGWFNHPDFPAAFPEFCVAQNPLDLACSYRDSVRLGTPAKTITRDTESYSVFGLISFDVTEKLRVTAEARYIRDEVEVGTNTSVDRVGQYILAVPIDFSLPLDQLPTSDVQKSDSVNPRFSADYQLSEDVMIYGSIAKGTKPAGFGTAQFALPQNTKVEQEKLWAYELGMKTEWFDRTLQANFALFFNDYTDRQLGITVRDPVSGWASSGITNAAGAETKGIEMDFVWRPLDPLTLGLAYAFVDATWTDFNYTDIRADSGGLRPKDQAICGNVVGDCAGGEVAGVPENAATLQANWTAPLAGDIEWFINAIGEYQDKRAVYDRVNTAYIDSRFIVDAQIGIQSESWSVQLYATNLFDDDTVRWGQGYQDFRDGLYGGGTGGEPRDESVMAFVPPPRVVGLRATWRFGMN